jgi:hypothetical protein
VLLLGESYIEPHVIEVHHVIERLRESVMEVWRAACQSAKDGPLKFPDIGPFSADQRAAGVRGPDRVSETSRRGVRILSPK